MTQLLTGIDALDVLIFGDPYYLGGSTERRARGFMPGEVVLIRGEPGAGKTTLALQIASNVLHAGVGALIVAVEESQQRLKTKLATFSQDVESMKWLDRDQVAELVKPSETRSTAGVDAVGTVAGTVVKAGAAAVLATTATQNPAAAEIAAAAVPIAEAALQRFFGALAKKIADMWRARQEQQEAEGKPGELKPDLLVIDSLNAFMNLILTAYPDAKPRLLLGTICDRLRTQLGNTNNPPVIILTGEYHFHDRALERHLPESFFCDTEIVLRTEPLRAARHQVHGDKVTLGYELSALVEDTARSVESRSFCRVLKCRSAPNQSRRCAYDIADKGLRFFETYPGDGKLLLFAENEQQRERWQSFLQRDMTDAYPALRYELFTMKTLQSVYESTRRLGHVPLRTDMFLASLDSYWVPGYRDYRLKRLINERLQILMRRAGNVDPHTLLSRGQVGPEPLAHREARAIQYPGFLNDVLSHYLLKLDEHLYQGTIREIDAQFLPREERPEAAPSRRALVRQRHAGRNAEAEEVLARLQVRYEALCVDLFGKPMADVLKDVETDFSLRQTFLRPLPRSKLQLFGQYDGALLRPLRREDMHEYVDGEDHWICVPYDANIGIFVVRTDLLEAAKPSRDEVRSALTRLKQREHKVWQALMKLVDGGHFDQLLPSVAALGGLRARLETEERRCQGEIEAAQADAHPDLEPLDLKQRLTWDRVLCLSAATGHGLGMETRTFDTMMAFFLELIWNCGGCLNVDASYRIRDKESLVVPLTLALHFFSAIFDLTKTERNQTVDPVLFDPSTPSVRYGDWLFSRFWYSTLVDAVTARTGGSQGPFVWQSPPTGRAGLEIVEMPRGPGERPGGHFACWGEWSFALLSGSENVELACDLVSNLMGALKVSDRGLRGAALPPVSHFYELFGDQRCIPGDLRGDIDLPRMTFKGLRDHYLEPRKADGARIPPEEHLFRQYVFDYRHCARAIYSELLKLKEPPVEQPTDAEAVERIVAATRDILTNIEKLHGSYLFVGETFRHDVIQTQQHKNVKRDPRFAASAAGGRVTLRGDDESVSSRIVDISISGCRLENDRSKLPGGALTLEFQGAAPLADVKLVWSRRGSREGNYFHGLKFDGKLERADWWKLVVDGPVHHQTEPSRPA